MNKHTTDPALLVSIASSRRPAVRRDRGFTLIELMLVVAIAAVLMGFGVPSVTGILNSNRLTSASNALLSSLRLARSEAFKRNGRVIVCKSADGDTCTSAGGWEQGWIVFHDANHNGEHDGDEVVIERGNPLAGSLRLTGNSSVGKYVSFVATGTARMTGGGFQAGTVTVCNQSAEGGEARQIVLNAVGRARVQKVMVGSCA